MGTCQNKEGHAMNNYEVSATYPKDPKNPEGKKIRMVFDVEARSEEEAKSRVMAQFVLGREAIENTLVMLANRIKNMPDRKDE